MMIDTTVNFLRNEIEIAVGQCHGKNNSFSKEKLSLAIDLVPNKSKKWATLTKAIALELDFRKFDDNKGRGTFTFKDLEKKLYYFAKAKSRFLKNPLKLYEGNNVDLIRSIVHKSVVDKYITDSLNFLVNSGIIVCSEKTKASSTIRFGFSTKFCNSEKVEKNVNTPEGEARMIIERIADITGLPSKDPLEHPVFKRSKIALTKETGANEKKIQSDSIKTLLTYFVNLDDEESKTIKEVCLECFSIDRNGAISTDYLIAKIRTTIGITEGITNRKGGPVIEMCKAITELFECSKASGGSSYYKIRKDYKNPLKEFLGLTIKKIE